MYYEKGSHFQDNKLPTCIQVFKFQQIIY